MTESTEDLEASQTALTNARREIREKDAALEAARRDRDATVEATRKERDAAIEAERKKAQVDSVVHTLFSGLARAARLLKGAGA